MSVISSNDIVVNYRLGNAAELDGLVSKLNAIDKEEKDALETLRQFNNQVKKTGNEGKESFEKVSNSAKKTRGEFDGLGNAVKGVGGMIAGAFAIGSVVEFSKQVFKVTAEFEKMQAVLKNTLGSNSAAIDAMERIKDFAKTTPFSVQELTASFVKLANQGFTPNIEQMKRLGDLASSTGKSFDQLTEAIIDAQTGEFERLKEFGIRAKKEGENVIFTFKGVETQVKFNNNAIREYILSLGDLNGVSGTSAAIAETLGGRVNNLGDAWDNFLNKIGNLLKPVLTEALTVTADFMDQINNLFGRGKTDAERFASTELQTYKSYQNSVINLTDDQLVKFVQKQKSSLEESQKDFIKYTKEANKYGKALRATSELGFGRKDIADSAKLAEKAAQDIAAAKGRIAAAEEQIRLREIATASVTKQKVTLSDAELKLLKDQYQARLKLLELEYTQEKLRNELAGFDAPQTKLKAEEGFLKSKFALQKEFGDKGVDLLKEESQTTSLQRQIVSKELESTLKTDTLQIKGYSESVKQFEKDQAENAKNNALDVEKARKASMDKTVKDNEEMAKEINASADKLADEEFKRIKKIQELKDEANQQAFDLAVNTTNSLFNLQSQYAANDFARKQKQFDEEVRLADGNVQKVTEINEKRALAEKEYREKEFRANQLQAIANAVFSAAPYIIKYSAGLPLTSANLALTLGALAAQTGLILAQPVPEFAKGVKNFEGGLAKVGEEGSELIKTPKGVYLSPNKPTLTFLPKGTDVITASKTREILSFAGKQPTNTTNQMIDVSPIAKAVSSIPVQSFELSEKGIRRFVKRGNTTTQILNKTRGANL
jgi:hypothetical protein